jgi:hypothetical protein
MRQGLVVRGEPATASERSGTVSTTAFGYPESWRLWHRLSDPANPSRRLREQTSGNWRLGPVGGRHDGLYFREYLAYSVGNGREGRTGRNSYKTRHQSVLNEVLATPVPPDTEPRN